MLLGSLVAGVTVTDSPAVLGSLVHVSPVLYVDELNLKLVYESKPNFAKAAELISEE
jgi:hypothetical protein